MTIRLSLVLTALFVALMGGCMTTLEGESVFFSFDGAKLHPSKDSTPTGFYVLGQVHNGMFSAQSEVLGEGEFATSGQSGWMELSTGKFYATPAATTPRPPRVRGFLTAHGFVPSSRKVL
jgi:hypothetical protein